jgi:hypothetical protein
MRFECSDLLNSYQNQHADCFEQVGDVLKFPFSQVAGKTYRVDTYRAEPGLKTISRIFLTVILVLCAPITVPLTLIGILFTMLSKSYKTNLAAFKTSLISPLPFVLKGNAVASPTLADAANPTPPFIWKPVEHKQFEFPEEFKGYCGEENIKKLMSSEKNGSLIARVVQHSCPFPSPMLRPDAFISTTSIVKHASLAQIPGIAVGAADDRNLVRSVLNTLFHELGEAENHNDWAIFDDDFDEAGAKKKLDECGERLKVVFKILTEEQLMNILAIEISDDSSSTYQLQRHEIGHIPLKALLHWKKEFKLVPRFVEACEQLSKYQEFVKVKANAEPVLMDL